MFAVFDLNKKITLNLKNGSNRFVNFLKSNI